ncbi:MAG: GDSL-type esterase/lipase family protein [Candidatus Thiodiazotropha sp.]|jgi:lysophospholipase L1-like esterase
MKIFRFIILLLFSTLSIAQEHPADQSTEEKDAPKLLIIGASYAQNWPIDKVGCLKVLNQGIDGEVSTQTRGRFKKSLLSAKPQAVLIWGFINDFSNNPQEMADETRETAIRNIEAMTKAAQNLGVIPILTTEVTMGEPDSLLNSLRNWIGELRGKQGFQQYISSNVMTVNRWIRLYAKQRGFPLLDIEQLMTNEKGNRKLGYFTSDLSHISNQAYQDLSAFSLPILEERLIKANRLCSD